MRKVEEFYIATDRHSNTCYKQAVEVVGVQQGSNVWVLSKDIHVEDGVFLTPEQTPYCWITANGLPPYDMQCQIPHANDISSGGVALREIISSIREVHRQNLPAALLLMGGQFLCAYYNTIYEIAGQVNCRLKLQ